MDDQPSVDSARVDRLAFYLLKAVNKAIRKFRLIADGDTILVAVSGGKDSLTLLDLLHRRQSQARESYTLIAAHINTDYHCGRAVSREWLADWCETRGIQLAPRDIAVADALASTNLSACFRCSWNRRKALFRMADDLHCNKIAFGHHADDIAETTLMNLFYSGRIARMETRMSLFDGRLVVIRPLALVEERDIVPFARASGYPITGEPCPAGVDSRRATVKKMLREIEREHHAVKRYIAGAMDHYHAALYRVGRAAPNDEAEL